MRQRVTDLIDERHDTVNIIKRINRILGSDLGLEARQSIRDWLSAWERGQKLARQGYRISLPPGRFRPPQLLLIAHKQRSGKR